MFCMQPSQSILVRSSHQFALIITVWKLITITQFTSERFNKIHDFHDGAILEELEEEEIQKKEAIAPEDMRINFRFFEEAVFEYASIGSN